MNFSQEIEDVSYLIRYCKISLLIYSGGSSLSNAGPFFDSPGRINHFHERALRFAYKDYQKDFESLLEQRNFVSIHVKNLQLLMTESYKTKSAVSPPFMNDIFC